MRTVIDWRSGWIGAGLADAQREGTVPARVMRRAPGAGVARGID